MAAIFSTLHVTESNLAYTTSSPLPLYNPQPLFSFRHVVCSSSAADGLWGAANKNHTVRGYRVSRVRTTVRLFGEGPLGGRTNDLQPASKSKQEGRALP